MPSSEELEQLLENAEEHLDAYEISRLETMRRAADFMNLHDEQSDYAIGGKHGNQEGASELG